MAKDDDKHYQMARAGGEPNLMDRLFFGTAEKTVRESSFYPDSFDNPFNADDLYQKDNTYGLFEDMARDDQVHVALELKKDLVLNSGWDIVVEEDGQEEIRDDLLVALEEDAEIPLEEQLHEVLSAYTYGFSISEKIFQFRPNGTLSFKALRTRHPSTFKFEQDEKGHVINYIQHGSKTDLKLNPRSIIHYVNNRAFQNPYGISDLRPAYNAWFSKRQIFRYLGIFAEKYASPIPVARYDKSAPQSAVDKIFSVLKKFQQKTAIVIPKEIETEFLESSKTGGDFYVKAINMFNMFIGRALFVPDLLGVSGSETSGGSFALGGEQIGIYAKHVNKRRKILELIINEHIVKPIVIHNWGFVDNFPKFRFNPISDTEANKAAETWLRAMASKVYKPNPEEINHFRSIVKFPEGDVEETPQPVMPGMNPNNPEDNPDDSPNDEPQKDNIDEKGELDEKPKEEKPNPEDDKKKEFQARPFKPTPGDFSKKVDFQKIKNKMESDKDKILSESESVADFIFDDLINQIRKKRILETGKIERFQTVKLKKLKELNTIIRKNLSQTFVDSKQIAEREIMKSTFGTFTVDEKFLSVLDEELFATIGDWNTSILARTRTELIAAIKDGRGLDAVLPKIAEVKESFTNVQIERLARTKTTEVFNKGRASFFEDSGVIAGYQYSAILDDRTTPICSGLHGKFFKLGTEPHPPMHFHCRSLIVPITKFEEFEPTNKIGGKSPDQFINDNLGKGFGKR